MDAAGTNVPDPIAHVRVPTSESTAMMLPRFVSPVFVTVAVTLRVAPFSILALVDFVTPMLGWMMVVDALAAAVTVTGV